MRTIPASVTLAVLLPLSVAADQPSDLVSALAENSSSIALENGRLTGPGAALLLDTASTAQFVNLGEEHNNRDLPRVATALFAMLHEAHGFNYLATEQDPLMMQRVSEEPVRGDATRVRQLATRYPHGFTFISDQELEMLAAVGDLSTAAARPIWGAEQAFGATHYVDELLALAPDEKSRVVLTEWRQKVVAVESKRDLSRAHFMADDRDKRGDLEDLDEVLAPRPGSRTRFLLDALLISDEIYGYYSRARAGEVVGLYNSSVREAYMKRRLIEEYRLAEAVDRRPPRVLLKYGQWHLFRGRGPGNAYTVGNFTHELAIANGMEAVGIFTVAYEDAAELANWPGWIKPLVAPTAAKGWWLVDLRRLRPLAHARRFHDEVPAESLDLFLRVIHGYEFLLVLSDSAPASYELTGWDY